GGADGVDRTESTLGSGYYLHPATGGVRVPFGDHRPVLEKSGGMGTGSDLSGADGSGGTAASDRRQATGAGIGAPLGSGISVCVQGICGCVAGAQNGAEHE